MMDREDIYLIGPEAVDNPVTLNDDLAHVLAADLRDNAAGLREVGQAFCCTEYPLREHLSYSRGIPSDEQADGVQIIECLISPGYRSHRAIRSRASA